MINGFLFLFVIFNNEHSPPKMKTRFFLMIYKTFGLIFFPYTYTSLCLHGLFKLFFFFFCLFKYKLYTHLCVPLRGFLVVKFHHSGCFPLYCPLDLKMDCPFISFCARAGRVGRGTRIHPLIYLWGRSKTTSPKLRQVSGQFVLEDLP